MQYLITGATGFLGAHLVSQLLLKGEAVTGTKRPSSSMEELEAVARFYGVSHQLELIKWINLDLQDPFAIEDALEGIDVLIHAAAIVNFNPSYAGQLMQINAYGTANLVNAALHKQTPRMVMVSSIAALGRTQDPDKKIHEGTHWEDSNLNSWYAKSKYRAELEVWRGMEEGLNAVIVNPGVITGIGKLNKGTCKLFKKAEGFLPLCPAGGTGFVDAQDVAKAIIHLAELPITRKRYLLINENLSWKDFFGLLRNLQGKKGGPQKLPIWIGELMSFMLRILENMGLGNSFLSSQSLRSAQHRFHYDGQLITRETGFTYSNYRERLQEAVKWFGQH